MPPAPAEEIDRAEFSLRVLPMVPDTGSDQNRASAAVTMSLRALGDGCRITGREDVNLNGLNFSRIEVEGSSSCQDGTNAEVWLYALNGRADEMITVMPERTPPYYLSHGAASGAGFWNCERFPAPPVRTCWRCSRRRGRMRARSDGTSVRDRRAPAGDVDHMAGRHLGAARMVHGLCEPWRAPPCRGEDAD